MISPLSSPTTFNLNALVSLPRGMTDAEAYRFLISGELPDFSTTPSDEVLRSIEVTEIGELTDNDIRLLLAGEKPTSLQAAGEPHTGAMIALVPTPADAQRIAVDDGEDPEDLHVTLAYLGEAALIPPEVRYALIGAIERATYELPTVVGKIFSVNLFNPMSGEADITAAGGPDPCVTWGVSGELLHNAHELVASAARDVFAMYSMQLPQQHSPWIPHITATYVASDDEVDLSAFTSAIGSVTFDQVRLAFGDDVHDIPLGGDVASCGCDDTVSAGFDPDQPRDTEGKWTDDVGDVVNAAALPSLLEVMNDREQLRSAVLRVAQSIDLPEGVTIDEDVYVGKGNTPTWKLRLINTQSATVGSFTRAVVAPDEVHNWQAEVAPKYQKNGIATRVNQAFENWYRESGIDKITVIATSSPFAVGGFVWARRGFDWDPDARESSGDNSNLQPVLSALSTLSDAAPNSSQLTEWQESVQQNPDDVTKWPTPAQLANFGYQPGSTDWPGKEVMSKTTWNGVRRLTSNGSLTSAVAVTMMNFAQNRMQLLDQLADEHTRWALDFGDVDSSLDAAAHDAYGERVQPILDRLNTLTTQSASVTAAFDPEQPRDPEGKWTDTSEGGKLSSSTCTAVTAAWDEAAHPRAPAGSAKTVKRSSDGDIETFDDDVTAEKERDVNIPGGGHNLRNYWVRGPGAAKIGWGTDGSFDRCVGFLSEHVKNPQGLCAEYHKQATGEWPAEKGVPSVSNIDSFRFNPNQPRDAEGKWTDDHMPSLNPTAPDSGSTEFPGMTSIDAHDMQRRMYPANQWNAAQRAAVRNYTGIGYSPMNSYLRNRIDRPHSKVADDIEDLRSIMRPSDQDVTLYRTSTMNTFNVPSLDKLRKRIGKTGTVEGFLSTTVKRDGVKNQCTNCVDVALRVPRGTNMAFLPEHSLRPGDQEMLLPPGMRYRVLSVTPNPRTGRQQVELEVLK